VSLITGQVTASTAATFMFNQPPGPSVVTLRSDTASAATAYVSAGSAATSANGLPLPSGLSVSWATYPGSKGVSVYCITASTTATIGWIISTSS
jgi:hypothetical protein